MGTEHRGVVDTLFCRWANVESAEKRRPRCNLWFHGAGVAESRLRSRVSADRLVRIAVHDPGNDDDRALSFLTGAFESGFKRISGVPATDRLPNRQINSI